jgi:hypothetical protein
MMDLKVRITKIYGLYVPRDRDNVCYIQLRIVVAANIVPYSLPWHMRYFPNHVTRHF